MYDAINANLDATIPADPMERSNLFAIALRLAFHDAGEADLGSVNVSNILGSDGCLSSSADNSGLIESWSLVNTVIEPLWQTVCDKITRADFWVLYANLILQRAEPTGFMFIPYQYGRPDNQQCEQGSGRLPSAQLGLDEFLRVFSGQMGLSMFEATVLLGAHTLGHVHPKVSGYGLPGAEANYTINAFDSTPDVFDNEYFKIMLNKVRFFVFLNYVLFN